LGLIKVIGELIEGQKYIHEIDKLHIDENNEAVKSCLRNTG